MRRRLHELPYFIHFYIIDEVDKARHPESLSVKDPFGNHDELASKSFRPGAHAFLHVFILVLECQMRYLISLSK